MSGTTTTNQKQTGPCNVYNAKPFPQCWPCPTSTMLCTLLFVYQIVVSICIILDNMLYGVQTLNTLNRCYDYYGFKEKERFSPCLESHGLFIFIYQIINKFLAASLAIYFCRQLFLVILKIFLKLFLLCLF